MAEQSIILEAPGGAAAVPWEEFKAAMRTAQAVEHQRLSAAIQRGAEGWEEWCVWLAAWKIVITLCRETFERHPRTYQDHLRFLALRDAADAIARAAIGEA